MVYLLAPYFYFMFVKMREIYNFMKNLLRETEFAKLKNYFFLH